MLPRTASEGAHLGRGRGLVKRAWRWARLNPLTGSRQPRRDCASGPSTKARSRKAGWGMERPARGLGAPHPAAPQHDIAVKHAVTPALPGAAAKFTLGTLQCGEQRERIALALQHQRGICKAALRRADRRCGDYPRAGQRTVEGSEFLLCGAHHPARRAMACVPPIASQRDQIEAAQMSSAIRCLGQSGHKAGACGRGKNPCPPGAARRAQDRAGQPARRVPRSRIPRRDRPIHRQ